MNKLIAGLFGAALIANVAFADAGAPAPSAKDLSKAVEKVNYVESDVAGVKLSGYVDVNYIYNFYAGDNALRSGVDAQNFGNFNVSQVKVQLEKPLTNENKLQAGFVVGAYLGQDFGGEASSLAVANAYVNARIPVGNGIDIKAGKFVTWIGYESPERPANLNITFGEHGFFQPTYLTGVALEYPVNNIIDLGIAVGNGSSMDSNIGSNGFLNHGDGYAATAKIDFKVPGGNANWQHAVYYSWDAAGEQNFTDVYGLNFQKKNSLVVYDGILNWVPKFTNGKLLLAANYDIGNWTNTDGANKADSTFVTAALYAKYQFTDVFSLAGRGTYVHANELGLNEDLWSVTLTAGFDLVENLKLRTEYRFDFGNDRVSDGYLTHNSGHTVAVEAVYVF
ncbi:MAG: porin [Verrucomicrobiales bacterium]|jgi:hypothetical protein|nr:porin [Verrucomicrobiales bacterium]